MSTAHRVSACRGSTVNSPSLARTAKQRWVIDPMAPLVADAVLHKYLDGNAEAQRVALHDLSSPPESLGCG
ncbi:hypothetical protein EES45_07240 [Streptomyces sp. ADI97-07]|nr:hypothetical protein EES45_07240 [Streptomyces sp. ADI97-07]